MGNYPLKTVVALGVLMMNKHGYMSVSDAKQKNQTTSTTFSTAQHVKSILHSGKDWDMDVDVDKVEDVISYVYNLVPPNQTTRTGRDYYEKLVKVYSKPEVKYEEIGMVVSALAFFNNPKVSNSDYRDMIVNSKYIGELKNRDNFFVKLLKETFLQQQNCYVYKFITREGDLGFFFKEEKLDLISGDCFMFKGTPIEHKEDRYDKVPCTKFNRVAHVKNFGSKTGE